MFTKYIEAAQKVLDVFPLKNAIEKRIHNDRFEKFITQNMESLRSLALFGNDIRKLSELDKIKKELDVLTNVKDIILRGASVISLGEVKSLPLWDLEQKKLFEDQIIIRNNMQQKSNTNSSIVAELCRLKAQILEEHLKLYPDDSTCPLCGADWKQHQNMLDAVSIRIQKITNSMSQNEKNLINLITKLNDKLISINSYMNNRVAELKGNYNKFLHIALVREKSRFENIEKITKRLNAIGTSIDYSFNQNEEIIDARLQALISSIRSKKLVETETLPEDWKQIIYSSFKVVEDFYILDQQDFIDKVLYIKLKANEARNKDLAKSALLLREIQKENQAAQNVGLKMKNLRETLEKVERTYAEHTISEIELIFHIYSGRLIQNYQRGLGLFIESRDGKQLRFLTAEKSEHDAILSMSSGQVSALSLAFFLSLNKVYARVPIILIDDPSQSLDEVNIASLTDLLRGELKHRQLIVSSHEGDISAYMRYRFKMAGLSSCSLNMQRLAKESGNNSYRL